MSVVIVSAVQDHPDKKGKAKKVNKKTDTLIASYWTFPFKQDCSEDLYSLII